MIPWLSLSPAVRILHGIIDLFNSPLQVKYVLVATCQNIGLADTGKQWQAKGDKRRT